MKFIRDMIARKASGEKASKSALKLDPAKPSSGNMMDFVNDEIVLKKDDGGIPITPKPAKVPSSDAKDVWDIDLDAVEKKAEAPSDALTMVSIPEPKAAGAARPRTGRVKTRLLGFEHSDGTSDAFDTSKKTTKTTSTQFPVGWIVVVDGPGRGYSFTLFNGMSQIGRGDDQAIQLNYGDETISRENHAAIAYDPESHDFFLGHGGKSNLVRLNAKPVLSTEPLKTNDLIRIGETTLRFVCLCDKDFNWIETEDKGEADDVAIA